MGFTLNSNSLAGLQGVYDGGTPAQKAAFQSSVSEYPALLQSQNGTGPVVVDRYPYTLFASASAPAPLMVVNGEIVHTPSPSANSAGYLQVDLGAPITRIGAEVAWPANNAGTAVTLVVPFTPWSSGVVTDAGLHITIYANGIWANEYLAPAAGGGITRTAYASNATHGRFGYVGDGVFRDFEVILDREHNRIAVRFPDGSISTHACPYLQYCGNYAIWELFESAGGATQPAKFRKIWADTKNLSRNYRGDMDVFGPVFSGPASRTFSGNQTIYCEGTNCHFITLNGNLTGLATVGQRTGQEIELHFIQDATGGRTVSLGASFVLAGGAYVPTPGANKRDVIKFRHHLGTWYEIGRVVNL